MTYEYLMNNVLTNMFWLAFRLLLDDVIVCYKNKKQSRNRPGVAQTVPGGLGSQIS
jgi:hypothetical protein